VTPIFPYNYFCSRFVVFLRTLDVIFPPWVYTFSPAPYESPSPALMDVLAVPLTLCFPPIHGYELFSNRHGLPSQYRVDLNPKFLYFKRLFETLNKEFQSSLFLFPLLVYRSFHPFMPLISSNYQRPQDEGLFLVLPCTLDLLTFTWYPPKWLGKAALLFYTCSRGLCRYPLDREFHAPSGPPPLGGFTIKSIPFFLIFFPYCIGKFLGSPPPCLS